jgi:hypothetical protein
MRSHLKVSAILVVTLFGSSGGVLAQTGEFASPVPGSVVHRGYELQDWWQSQRKGVPEPAPAVETIRAPVVLLPPQLDPTFAEPKRAKTTKKVTTSSRVRPKQTPPQ